jgi:flagellar motility protein MotE (MotC chaperone)
MTAFESATKLLKDRLAEVDHELGAFRELTAERDRLVASIAALSGKPAKRQRRTGRQAEVLAIIKSLPGISTSEIADALGMVKPSQASNLITKLRDEGAIRTQNRKHYLS